MQGDPSPDGIRRKHAEESFDMLLEAAIRRSSPRSGTRVQPREDGVQSANSPISTAQVPPHLHFAAGTRSSARCVDRAAGQGGHHGCAEDNRLRQGTKSTAWISASIWGQRPSKGTIPEEISQFVQYRSRVEPLMRMSKAQRYVLLGGHHSFGQRKAAGTASLTQAFAPSVAGIGAAGDGHAVELHLASGGKN